MNRGEARSVRRCLSIWPRGRQRVVGTGAPPARHPPIWAIAHTGSGRRVSRKLGKYHLHSHTAA